MSTPPTDQPPWLRYTIVLTGLGLIIYEAVIYRGEPRYWLLVIYTAMVGLPSLFGLGAAAIRRGESSAPPQPPAASPPASPPAPPPTSTEAT